MSFDKIFDLTAGVYFNFFIYTDTEPLERLSAGWRIVPRETIFFTCRAHIDGRVDVFASSCWLLR